MEPRENLFGFAPESISRAKKREVEREDDLAQRIHGEKKIACRNNDGRTTVPSRLIEPKNRR